MFKAKLIEDNSYYRLRSKQLILMLLPCVPVGLIDYFYQTPVWVALLMLGLYISLIIIIATNQKRINSIAGNKLVEMNHGEIIIKSKNGTKEEVIKLDRVEKLILKDEYSMPQESIKDVRQEITGKAKRNFIIIQQGNRKRQLDFVFDSYYMLNQLNKLIESWIRKEYIIERTSE